MAVKFNKKSNTYTIYNKFETHNNLEFSRLYRNIYFNNLGVSVFKNEQEQTIVLVLTKFGGDYTPKFYAIDLDSWRKLDDSFDDLNDVTAVHELIKRFF
jgi:hypothetical protein